MPMPFDPRLVALAEMMQKRGVLRDPGQTMGQGERSPGRMEVPPDVQMQLLNPGREMEAAGKVLPERPSTKQPFEMNDAGQMTARTPADALLREGFRRQDIGETMTPPADFADRFPGLEDFLSPGM